MTQSFSILPAGRQERREVAGHVLTFLFGLNVLVLDRTSRSTSKPAFLCLRVLPSLTSSVIVAYKAKDLSTDLIRY
jgi:hypothetical protein